MSSKGAYLILTHVHQVINKGPNKGKMQTHESCEFVDRYKLKHLQGSTVIMNVVERTFVKNTYRQEGLTYDQVEEHIIKGYADKYTKFLELVGAPIPEALLLDKEKIQEELAQIKELKEVSDRYDELEKSETNKEEE